MKKLPKINKFEIVEKISNNKKIFDSLKDEEKNSFKKEERIKKEEKVTKNSKFNNSTVREKLKELINQNSYIFNKKVTLIFSDHEEILEIAGVVNNHIITMDNKIIKIDDIKDIKY